MSGNQDDKTKPVYHSYHSYLFSEVIKRHPNLTTEELEKEFKTKVEGAYVTKLLKDYVAFCPIPSDQVDVLKTFVADELTWSRYIYGKPDVGLTPEQGRDIFARFQAKIAKLEEEHADEKKKLQSEHTANHEAFLKGACEDYSSQIRELCTENKRLEEENAGLTGQNEYLDNDRNAQYALVEVLLGEKMDLKANIEKKEAKTKDREDEIAELRKDKAKLQKGLAEQVECTERMKSSYDYAMFSLDISRDTVIKACDTEKKLKKKITELEDENKAMKEGISALAMLVKK